MSSPSIIRIGIYKSRIKLHEPFIISLGKLEYAENIIVEIEDNEGVIGYGEGSPFRTIHGESLESCFWIGRDLSTLLLKKNPLNIEECLRLMNRFVYANTCIKSAFEIALHDLSAKHAELPLYKFLGATKKFPLYTDYTVSIDSVEKMCIDAEKIIKNGFPVIKVKLGGSAKDDVERIRKIRERIGMQIPLRIDANQGWTRQDAPLILKQLEEFNIQHCEEPLPRRDFMYLEELRKQTTIPIMADESCFDHHDAERLYSIDACDSFNVKLGKTSGILNALKLICFAEKHSMPLQIGGFLESRLGFTAAAHVAMCCQTSPMIDFDTPLMFSEDFVDGGIEYSSGGRITLPSGTGLGASFSKDYLRSLSHHQCE